MLLAAILTKCLLLLGVNASYQCICSGSEMNRFFSSTSVLITLLRCRYCLLLDVGFIFSSCQSLIMAAAKIIAAVVGSFAIAYVSDHLIADQKIFGGTTPHTVASKDWWEETDKKFQAWPRTAGPPVVMNPISRQNYIVKPRVD